MRAEGITIRPWQEQDRQAVQSLLRYLSKDAEVKASDAPTYVAEHEGVVVGMVTLCVYTTLTGTKAYLDHLVVAPEIRRRGVGRALMEYAIDRARDAAASRVDLTARDAKQAAHGLYRSLGFEPRETSLFRLLITPEARRYSAGPVFRNDPEAVPGPRAKQVGSSSRGRTLRRGMRRSRVAVHLYELVVAYELEVARLPGHFAEAESLIEPDGPLVPGGDI
jgi:ribosomal protein S18 acetylase RimI-like enzyme